MSAARPQTLTRGSFVMIATKVLVVVLAYAMNRYLSFRLGAAAFGLFGVVVTVLIWLELLVAEGLPLWVAGNVDSTDGWSRLVPRRYLAAQLALSVGLMAAMVAAAPLLARAFGAPDSVPLFRVAALDIPAFAFYNLLLGLLLGSRLYGGHSASAAAYGVSKLVLTVLLVGTAGLATLGAALGNVLASWVGLAATLVVLYSAHVSRKATAEEPRVAFVSGTAEEPPPAPVLSGSAAPASLMLLQALIFSADLWLVRALLPGSAAGFYRAASLVAQVPFTLLGGLTWGLYAAYSAAYRRGDTERCRHYVSQATRLLLVGGVLWAAVIAPTAGPLMALLFPPEFRVGGPLLAVLSVGFVLGNVGITLAPTLLVEGRARVLLASAAGLLALEVAVAVLLAPLVGALGAAIACGGVLALGGLALLVHVRERLNYAFWTTLGRILVPGAVVAAAAALLPVPRPVWLVLWYPVLALAFFALLWLTGGFGKDDLEAIRGGLDR
jgi:O-antigen/teichoic acid export membrane protein